MSLQGIADDLTAFLQEKAPEYRPTVPDQVEQVARTAVDYVLTQVSADDGPTTLGEAVSVACSALAAEAKVDPDEVVEHAARYLEDAAAAVRKLGR